MKGKTYIPFVLFMAIILLPISSFGQRVEPKVIESGVYTGIGEELRDILGFRSALEKGNLSEVRYLVESYPERNLLSTPIDINGKKQQPICIAAAAGYLNLIDYMLEKDPKLVKKNCGYKEEQALWVAIEKGHADVALTILRYNPPVKAVENYFIDANKPVLLSKVAEVFKDKGVLTKLIPALLDAGASPYDPTSGKSPVGLNHDYSADAFFHGALNNNRAFIITLRDEMKRRGGKQPQAHYYSWVCPNYNGGDFEENFEKIFEKEIKFLKKYNIEIGFKIKYIDWDYCE